MTIIKVIIMLLILFPWNMIRNAFSLWQQVVWWESSISSQLICGHGYTMKLFEEGEKREGSVYLSNLPPSSKKKPQVVSGCKKERRGTVTTCQLWLKQQPVFVIFSLCICVFLLLLCSLYLSYFYLGIFAYFLKISPPRQHCPQRSHLQRRENMKCLFVL